MLIYLSRLNQWYSLQNVAAVYKEIIDCYYNPMSYRLAKGGSLIYNKYFEDMINDESGERR